MEPGVGGAYGVENVVIRNNDIGPGRLFFVAAAGNGRVDNITIQGNRLRGQAMQFYVIDQAGGMRRDWRVLDNTSDLPFSAPHLAVMRFTRVDGVTVRGNTQPFKGTAMYGAKAQDSCNLALTGNTYPGAIGQSLVLGGC